MSNDHSHSHNALGPNHVNDQNTKQTVKVMKISTGLIFSFMLLEFFGGLFANSMALISDSMHMLSDFLSLVLALVAMHISKRKNDTKKTYGYSRFEVVASFVNAFALVFICIFIIAESVHRVIEKPPVDAKVMIPIAIAGLICNLVVIYLCWKDAHHGKKDNTNKQERSLLMKGVFLHFLSDTVGSLIAIIAGIIIYYTQWYYVDPILSLILVVLILRSCWYILKDCTHILMEGAPSNIDSLQLKKDIETNISGVHNVHHIHLWMLNEVENLITLHVELHSNYDSLEVLQEIKVHLIKVYNIKHSTIQIETIQSGCLL